ncbi:MAG: hypothetical protein K1060chlam5_01253 [Candidatus Anoxychlamydiales bacterium]|nr:hypothetical protein [Candidatus Anoxychlamydiales bacterium]
MLNKKFKIEKNNKLYSLSKKELEDFLEIEYITNLKFEKFSYFENIKKRCANAAKEGYISKEILWHGIFYEKEISTNTHLDLLIKWINPIKEYGLFASNDLKKRTFIGEYLGLVRKYNKKIDDKNAYCFEYNIGYKKTPYTIDAREKGSLIRFVNHSDKPNISPLAVLHNGIIHIIFRTNRDVKKNEELTYDYGPNYWSRREKPN